MSLSLECPLGVTKQISRIPQTTSLGEILDQNKPFLNEVMVWTDLAVIYLDLKKKKKRGLTYPQLSEFSSLSYFSLSHEAAVTVIWPEF